MSSPPESFFREKKLPPKQAHGLLSQRDVKSIMLFLVGFGYVIFSMIVLKISTYSHQTVSIFALYAYGVIGGYGFLQLKRSYTDADRSRRILTEVLEKSAEARAITDPDGETLYANLRFNSFVETGEGPSLLSFARMFDNPEKTAKSLEDLRSRAVAAGSASMEFQTRHKGQQHWFQVTCQSIAGWPGFMHWRFDDISQMYQMAAAVREERERLRDFTDNAPVGFFSVGADGKFLFANDTLLNLLKTDRPSLIGKMTLHDFLVNPPKNSRPCDVFEGGGFHQHDELLMKTATGRVFKAAITHSITLAEDQGLISRSIVYDLTSEQNMQEALRESEDRFQRLFEEAPVGICMLSAQGTISDANQTLATMLGQSLRNINGQSLTRFIGAEAQKRTAEWLRQLSKDTSNSKGFIEVPLQGHKNFVTQLYARRFSGSDSFVLHFIDLTEQKNLERQFTQSQKMQAVGQLAGGIAHDFNNLLTAMIGFCDLLLLRHKPGDASFADIMQIKQNANRAANLVRQLLAFSRQQTLQPRVLDLTDVLQELSHLLRRLIGANIDLRMEHGTDLALIKADQGQMEQVFINLVVNARDAMPQGGRLLVRTGNITTDTEQNLGGEEVLPAGQWVAIDIEDTGTGIAPETLPRIFEPFFSTKEVGAGTGLGLATVHGIVHQTGGYIGVKTTLGKGTVFTIYLPQNKETAAAKTAVAEEKHVIHDLTGSSRILLVEDEDAVRIFSARALGNKGYQVADAPSAAVALKLLEDKQIDPEVLITDVMMPEMDGTALARIVREKYPHVKIIFISGYAEDRFKEHLGDHVYFLPKPFTLKQLATKVKEVIEDKN